MVSSRSERSFLSRRCRDILVETGHPASKMLGERNQQLAGGSLQHYARYKRAAKSLKADDLL